GMGEDGGRGRDRRLRARVEWVRQRAVRRQAGEAEGGGGDIVDGPRAGAGLIEGDAWGQELGQGRAGQAR
ncbi:hypothetical protein VM98_34135, partial [Streptomyces rubellomurinus subsp. indigoferus]